MPIEKNGKQFEILVVEDNPGDLQLIKEALKTWTVPYNLTIAQDGVEAMAILQKEGKYSDCRRPNLILLDLTLPKKDGRGVLVEIKADIYLKNIPVIVMTSSSNESDILASYNLYANCFITKPIDFDDYMNALKLIEEFWLKTAQLPPS